MDRDGDNKVASGKKKDTAPKKNVLIKKNRVASKKGLFLQGVNSLHFVKAALILRLQTKTYGENAPSGGCGTAS